MADTTPMNENNAAEIDTPQGVPQTDIQVHMDDSGTDRLNPEQSANVPVPIQSSPPIPNQIQQGQPNQPQNPNQPNAQPKPAGTPAPQAPEQHPSVQRAGWVHDVAETLAGGPKYQYNVDPNTGEMKKTPVPVSGKHLALAIALEALQGSLTGLAAGRGKGPGAAGAAAMAQQQAQQQKVKEQAQREASDNYARGAAIAETNMRMIRNEQISSQADSELQQRDVDLYSTLFKEAQDGGHIQQMGITPDQAQAMIKDNKLGITKDMLIPYQVSQVKNTSGQEVLTAHGVPKFEKQFALIDPLAKLTLDDDLHKKAVQYKLPGFVNPNTGEELPLSPNLQLRYHQLANVAEQVRSFGLADSAVKGAEAGNVHALHSGTAPQASVPAEQSGSALIKDSNLATINDKAESTHDLSPVLLSAIASQESSGNTKVKDSPPNKEGVYAVGPYQVTPGTAKQFKNPDTGKPYTEAEIRDPQTNANVAAEYLSNLIRSNNGDVHKALVAYHGAAADVLGVTGEKYATQTLARIPQGQAGLLSAPTQTPAPSGEPAPEIPSLQDALSKGIIQSKDITVTASKLMGLSTMLDGKMSVKDIAAMAEKDKSIDQIGRASCRE